MQPVDDHTLQELQIVSEKYREGSILNYFDRTRSQGGRDFLKNLIKLPKQSVSEILSVQELLKALSEDVELWEISVSRAYVAASESYYASNIAHTMSQDAITHYFETLIFFFRNPAEFYLIQSGLLATIKVLVALDELLRRIDGKKIPYLLKEKFEFLTNFFDSFVIKSLLKRKDKSLSKRYVFYLDYYFRKQEIKAFRMLLDIYYSQDAYISIVKSAEKNNLCYPDFLAEEACFQSTNIWHPLIPNAIKNDFLLNMQSGICILTGANTSGKTTFLKTVGIVVYLAHLGWPVPAQKLSISFFDKLFTSIHLSDDLELGYSHFYNEIMRIKSIAETLHNGKKCFTIVDELFRGTNQEDSLHCSRTVLNGFSNFKNSTFIVSTHLMELMDGYRQNPDFCFHCFKTNIEGNDFKNTFRLETGIASEKVGRLILEKVGIPDLLNSRK